MMDDPVSLITSFDDWRLPYIGRPVNDTFKKSFSWVRDFVMKKEFAWDDAPDCTTTNIYDSEWCVHYLQVDLYDDGPLKGCIKSIGAYHTKYWHTDSNWHDHAESRNWQVREANRSEISEYCKELNRCTIDNSKEIAFRLFQNAVAYSFGNECQLVFDHFSKDWYLKTKEYDVVLSDVAKCVNPCFVFVDFLISRVARSIFNFRSNAGAFLDRISVAEFYRAFGMSGDVMKNAFIGRLKKDKALYLEFVGLSEKVWLAMMSARFDEIVSSRERVVGVEMGIYSGGGIHKYYNVGYKSIFAVSIPKGSLCYFNSKGSCVSFVSPNNEVYSMKRCMEDGRMNIRCREEGMVYDDEKYLGVLKGVGIDAGDGYLVEVGEYGAIIKGGRYLGYVMVFDGFSGDVGKSPVFNSWQKKSDQRLIGLFLSEYVTIDELEDCQKKYEWRKMLYEARLEKIREEVLEEW